MFATRMREEIQTRCELNLRRVRKLVQVYRDLAGAGRGRRPVETVDVLRSAVVFLHAALEDVLRTLLVRRWATSSPEHFEDVPFALAPHSRQTKVTLAELALHREKTVQQVLQESIVAHLDRSTFNNIGDVKTALVRSGVDPAALAPYARAVAAMISRRHQIVHRADRDDVAGFGYDAGASLGVGAVGGWIASVELLFRAIVARL